MLAAQGLTLAREGRAILSGIDTRIEPGSLTVLVGPNGAGKSTLLAALAGDLAPSGGQLLLDGIPLSALPLADLACRRAMLPQRPGIAFAFPVAALVAMGLHPHGIAPQSPAGRLLVADAIAAMDLGHLADRPATAISGGEAQRAHLARVLVQVEAARQAGHAPILLLDEPATGLDWRHQFALVRCLRRLAGQGVTVVVSLHDLPLARALEGTVLLLAEGRLQASGPAHQLLAPPMLARWFGLDEAEARLLAA